MTIRPAALAVLASSLIASVAVPVGAQPRAGWGDRADWGDRSDWPARGTRFGRAEPSREGHIEVARFRADGAAAEALGKGAIGVTASAAGAGDVGERELATYEAAVVDVLAKSGYEVATPDPVGGQVAELRVLHAVVQPEEPPHKPVSGAMTMGVSNHGSMMGMAIAVDLSKPAKALVSTRVEARIKDRRSGAVLWEGRAEIVTREGDSRWGEQAIAARLATALFDGFPTRTGEGGDRR